MNLTKRQKTEQSLPDTLLCAKFATKSRWIVLYLAVVLGCDTPILEALLYSTYAYTAVKTQPNARQTANYAFVSALVTHLQDYVCSLRPALSISTNSLTTKVNFPNEKWIQFHQPLLTSTFKFHTLRVVCGSDHCQKAVFAVFISYESSRLFDVPFQPIRYGGFPLVLEQLQNDLKRFLEKKNKTTLYCSTSRAISFFGCSRTIFPLGKSTLNMANVPAVYS